MPAQADAGLGLRRRDVRSGPSVVCGYCRTGSSSPRLDREVGSTGPSPFARASCLACHPLDPRGHPSIPACPVHPLRRKNVIRLRAVTICAAALLSAAAQANDGAPPYTFEGAPGPVLELNDQGKPSFQAEPRSARPATPAPAPAPAALPAPPARPAPPAPVATPTPVVPPAPVAAPAPVAPPARVAVPAPVAPPAPVAMPVPAPAPVVRQPAPPAPVAQPGQAGTAPQEPAAVTPVTTAPLQWETPPQGKSPFADPEPVKMFEPEPPKACTKEAFDRGMCVAR
jgi:hypothetical protein